MYYPIIRIEIILSSISRNEKNEKQHVWSNCKINILMQKCCPSKTFFDYNHELLLMCKFFSNIWQYFFSILLFSLFFFKKIILIFVGKGVFYVIWQRQDTAFVLWSLIRSERESITSRYSMKSEERSYGVWRLLSKLFKLTF